MKKANIAILIIIIFSFIIAIYLYPQMPDRMASHWNANGEVDSYMPKFWALFLMPMLSAVMFLMFLLIPKLDPLKKNIEKFRKYFDGFVVIMVLFLFYIYILTLAWNSDYRFRMAQMIIPALAILFYYAGILIQHAKRNWFIGIRTPWTLSSESVWDKTHRLGGILFKIIALIILASMLSPRYMLYLFLIPLFAVIIYIFVYSYLEYKKVKEAR